MSSLHDLFLELATPMEGANEAAALNVASVPDHDGVFVGRDTGSHAIIVFAIQPTQASPISPIRLSSLDVQFQLRCLLKGLPAGDTEGWFTVVKCRSLDPEVVRYFFSAGQSLLALVGTRPSQEQLAQSVRRLAQLFQKMQRRSRKSLDGLFGELFVMLSSRQPARALQCWHSDPSSRYDFSGDGVRLEVKATAGRTRLHVFSYDQCNPPEGVAAVIASLFVERIPGGISLEQVISEIRDSVAGDADLVFKLYEVVAETLGDEVADSMSVTFDHALAKSSLRFFMSSEVPAIRDDLPEGVSEVRFRSNLASVRTVSPDQILQAHPRFLGLLPSS